MTLRGQVPDSALVKLSTMLDASSEPCLVVFKNGVKIGITIGQHLASFTCNIFDGEKHESREWPIISTDENSKVFSESGERSCIADTFSRIGGILTGGSGATETTDITYGTPISFIMTSGKTGFGLS